MLTQDAQHLHHLTRNCGIGLHRPTFFSAVGAAKMDIQAIQTFVTTSLVDVGLMLPIAKVGAVLLAPFLNAVSAVLWHLA